MTSALIEPTWYGRDKQLSGQLRHQGAELRQLLCRAGHQHSRGPQEAVGMNRLSQYLHSQQIWRAELVCSPHAGALDARAVWQNITMLLLKARSHQTRRPAYDVPANSW